MATYRDSAFRELCQECKAPADTTCVRCDAPVCAAHAGDDVRRCAACERSYALATWTLRLDGQAAAPLPPRFGLLEGGWLAILAAQGYLLAHRPWAVASLWTIAAASFAARAWRRRRHPVARLEVMRRRFLADRHVHALPPAPELTRLGDALTQKP